MGLDMPSRDILQTLFSFPSTGAVPAPDLHFPVPVRMDAPPCCLHNLPPLSGLSHAGCALSPIQRYGPMVPVEISMLLRLPNQHSTRIDSAQLSETCVTFAEPPCPSYQNLSCHPASHSNLFAWLLPYSTSPPYPRIRHCSCSEAFHVQHPSRLKLPSFLPPSSLDR
ncbi:uncharacterized protein LY79DRAFT_542820 [Colletotrichum navitas]|uniref:Uncharacterized protein n=1 Tax=Colletotrichum navitas TaxID=681940 RepID=A0AAD8V902_9PEZI|nr:uncharacterized protein LY79DRAFT_542820 [Colletotrichum navitas]KAK1596823.1 hypothetical protein LY79DRAFT_542820 [Colletotrichum navitas]